MRKKQIEEADPHNLEREFYLTERKKVLPGS